MMPNRSCLIAEDESAIKALISLQRSNEPAQACVAYQAALQQWPDNLALLLAFGNAAYAAGDRITAAAVFRHATEAHPDCDLAFNNLASLLAEMGELDEACRAVKHAAALNGPGRSTAYALMQEIEASRHRLS